MSREIYNLRAKRYMGYLFIVIAWFVSFFVGTRSIDIGIEIYGYQHFMIVCIGFVMFGCTILSIISHKELLKKDDKESFFSIFSLLLYSTASLLSILLHFKWIVEYLSHILNKDNDIGIASFLSCSIFLVLAGLFGFSCRRKTPNIKTGITWCFFILAFCALIKGT